MDILVIENEKPAADKLIRLLDRLDSTIRVLKVVETVEDTGNCWDQQIAGSHAYGHTA